jgi:hypothetical protein
MPEAISPHPITVPGNKSHHIHRLDKEKVKIVWGAVVEFKRFYNLVASIVPYSFVVFGKDLSQD